jgi:hypothetical protein
MSLDVAQRAEATRRRRFWSIAATGLVSVLVTSTGLALLLRGEDAAPAPSTSAASVDGRAEIEPANPAQSKETARPGNSPAAEAWVPPDRQVTLPAGTDQIDELPVAFPHTPEGAAAAEVAKDRYSSTVDYRLSNLVARVYLAPELAPTADQASTAAVTELRAKLGVADSGPAPVDVSAVTRPVGIQWEAEGDDRTEVSVLVQIDYRTRERTWSELAASTTVWQWMEGEAGRPADWRLVGARQPEADLAQIGTSAFNDAGWSALVTETAR